MSFNAIHSEEIDTISKLCVCVSEVKKWTTDNLLQLNLSDKTKFLIIGSRNQLSKKESKSFDAAGDIVDITSSTRNLGIIFDDLLTQVLVVRCH